MTLLRVRRRSDAGRRWPVSRGIPILRPRRRATGSLRQALTWSPDGRFLLFARGDSSLWRVPAVGGAAERVGLDMRVKTPALHPDGKRLVFVGLPALLPDGRQQRASVSTLENFLPR